MDNEVNAVGLAASDSNQLLETIYHCIFFKNNTCTGKMCEIKF